MNITTVEYTRNIPKAQYQAWSGIKTDADVAEAVQAFEKRYGYPPEQAWKFDHYLYIALGEVKE